jgi:hypothetical protein
VQGRERPLRVRKAVCPLSTASHPTIRLSKNEEAAHAASLSQFYGCKGGSSVASEAFL